MNEAFLVARLEAVSHKNIYFDREARDIKSGAIGPKHSLAGRKIPSLDLYTFFFLFGNNGALRHGCYIEIKRDEHLEEKIEGYFREEIGYIDITKGYVLTRDELFSIICDDSREFKRVARLCEKKWKELSNLLLNRGYILTKIKEGMQKNTALAFFEGEVLSDVLAKIGL